MLGRFRIGGTVASVSAAGLFAASVGAQTSTTPDATATALANAATLATINSTNVATANARADEQLKVIQALQAGGAGSGGGDNSAKTAEALLVSHYALAGAAEKLATTLKPIAGGFAAPATPLLIVWGSTPPSIGQSVQFAHDRDLIREALVAATDEWKAALATVKPPPKPKKAKPAPASPPTLVAPATADTAASVASLVAGVGGTVASANPVGLAITAAATLASLGRVDTSVSGLDVTIAQEQDRSIVETALSKHFTVDVVDFDIPFAPSDADLGMGELASGLPHTVTAYDAAYIAYHAEYLPRWAAAGGKTDKMPANVVAAGADLLAALQADQAFRKATFASTNGVSAASVIYAQQQLAWKAAGKPILYLRDMRAAASVRNNKGFFVGITRSPSDFEAAATIDYLLVASGQAPTVSPISGSAAFWTGVIHLWKLNKFLAEYPLAGSLPPPVPKQRSPGG